MQVQGQRSDRCVHHKVQVWSRQPCDVAQLNPVEECLKSRNKIYQLCRTEVEAVVNDYNPTLLLAWKANMDIQFAAESSLALANYVTAYVTKPEKSNLQEVWKYQ